MTIKKYIYIAIINMLYIVYCIYYELPPEINITS